MSEVRLRTAMGRLASGDVRADLTPDDFLRLMSGLSFGYDRPD
jgi:hypothetical protein